MPRPLEGSYPATLSTALLALIPFLLITTADSLFRHEVAAATGGSETALAIISGLAVAGYAFGALVGGDLIQRFPQRRLFLVCEAAFVIAASLAAAAVDTAVYGIAVVAIGGTTGLLLVIALPPVIQRFSAAVLPLTAATVDVAFFGAVTAGPLVGGLVAEAHAWRLFFITLAAVGCLSWSLAWLTLPLNPPPNPGLRLDRHGIALALAATFLPFWGTAELTSHTFTAAVFLVPLLIGLTCFVALLLIEYHQEEPLSPVEPMWNPLPVVGVIAAMAGGGAFVGFVVLAEQHQLGLAGLSPWETGLSLWPMIPAALIASAMLGFLFRTRWLPILTLSGMFFLGGGGALLLTVDGTEPGGTTYHAAAALLGLGAGATVSPGLFMAAFSLPSKMVGRSFALIELVRSEADFILAPILLRTARVMSHASPMDANGIRFSLWMAMAVAGIVTVAGVTVYLASGLRLWQPDLERWLQGDEPAVEFE